MQHKRGFIMFNYKQALDKAQAIVDSAGKDLTAEQQEVFDNWMEIANQQKPGRKIKPDSVILDDPNRGAAHVVSTGSHEFGGGASGPVKGNQVKVFENDKDAYNFAKLIGNACGHPASMAYCAEHHIESLHSGGVNTRGGYLVPDQYAETIINLRDDYGVFRRFAFPQKMTSDTTKTPRITGHGEVFYVGEGSAITPSNVTIDQVNLVAKKPAMLFTFSRELQDDSAVTLGNLLADEIAWSLAQAEDLAGFTGDGTSTYGGIYGICPKLITLNGVDDGGGLQLATGDLMSEVVIADFANMIAKAPAYAKKQGRAKFYCSSYFYAATMLRLMVNVGGNTLQSFAMGQPTGPQFMGFEVVFSETMPTADAASQIVCLFGDLSAASTLGDRLGVTIESSDSAEVDGESLFERDLYALRGLERYDINNHDLGTAEASGPIVGLITAPGE